MNELEALRDENRRLRDLVRSHEVDRDTKEFYERLLTEIGKSIGFGLSERATAMSEKYRDVAQENQ